MKNRIHSKSKTYNLARQIENKELIETEEILLLQDEYGWSVAHYLAIYSDRKNYWSTENKEVLMLQTSSGVSVAYLLAKYHPTWKTDDIEILISYSWVWKQVVEDILVEKNKI